MGLFSRHDLAMETHHLSLQAAQQQSQDLQFFMPGVISQYDPGTHRCKVVLTDFFNVSDGSYMETGWIQMGSLWTGNGYGMQIAPYGGATITDPTGQMTNENANPEQVLVSVISREGTLYACDLQSFNQMSPPPGQGMDVFGQDGAKATYQITNGEFIIRHPCGNYIIMKNDGSINIGAVPSPNKPFQEQDDNSITRTVNMIATAQAEEDQQSGQSDTLTSDASVAAVSIGDSTSTNQTATANLSSYASGDNTTPSATTTVSSETNGLGDTASTTVSATASNLGIGTTDVTAAGYSANVNINATAPDDGTEANVNIRATGTNGNALVTITAGGEVLIDAPLVLINSSNIELGNGALKRVLTDTFAQFFNNHVHSGVMTGSGDSGVPTVAADESVEAQNVKAS